MDFADKLLWLTLILFAIVAASGGLAWWLGRDDEPVDEVREERRERRNGEVAKSDGG